MPTHCVEMREQIDIHGLDPFFWVGIVQAVTWAECPGIQTNACQATEAFYCLGYGFDGRAFLDNKVSL